MSLRVVATGVLALALFASACTSESTVAAEPSGTQGEESVLQPNDPVGVVTRSFAGTEAAPDFPGDLDWLNVARPVSLADLRGKVVLLDFWTYGCINCIHIIPDLKRLEEQYADELVVVGVHSAKFENEGETDNIRNIVARYDIQHPVVNDKDFLVWRQWGAQAWPTLVLIDPNGNIVGGHSGEGIYAVFQPVIDSLVEEFDAQDRVDRTPLDLVLEKEALPDSVLSFPGKVLADGDGGRLFVADTNHHRILVTDLATGEVLDVAGSGLPGYLDGGFGVAEFDQPQGMALAEDGRTLYLADTGSHAIRALDLETRQVSTLLGTGDQAARYPPLPGFGPDVAITSPWDVALDRGTLYIAMAGSHQIWALNLETSGASWFAGSGRESTLNGRRLDAELAQPSAVVVLSDGSIAFADSESSSIRKADPGEAGETGILAGSDTNLFEFGDVDGIGTEARLQHPLGLEFAEGALWVADTYNSKIKQLDPATGRISTLSGGDQGWADGTGTGASFSEPGGISYAAGRLYVADTNNHAVRVVDLESGEVSTRVLFGIERFPSAADDERRVVELDGVVVASGPGELRIDVGLPEGYKFNELAPFAMTWSADGSTILEGDRSIVAPEFPLTVAAVFGDGDLAADLTIYYCTDDAGSLCFLDQVRVEVEVRTSDGAPTSAVLRYSVEVPGL